ncbi:hypothetical protein A5791_00150 [Mycobacterium sp. 852002-51163_SCH5372311]|nr:hypothetical protein A5791_00150 [Mycobacterium sp. 852002-51163_SCH5372311]
MDGIAKQLLARPPARQGRTDAVGGDVESEPAVAVKREIQIPDWDDWRYRGEVDSGHTTVWQPAARHNEAHEAHDHTTN